MTNKTFPIVANRHFSILYKTLSLLSCNPPFYLKTDDLQGCFVIKRQEHNPHKNARCRCYGSPQPSNDKMDGRIRREMTAFICLRIWAHVAMMSCCYGLPWGLCDTTTFFQVPPGDFWNEIDFSGKPLKSNTQEDINSFLWQRSCHFCAKLNLSQGKQVSP